MYLLTLATRSAKRSSPDDSPTSGTTVLFGLGQQDELADLSLCEVCTASMAPAVMYKVHYLLARAREMHRRPVPLSFDKARAIFLFDSTFETCTCCATQSFTTSIYLSSFTLRATFHQLSPFLKKTTPCFRRPTMTANNSSPERGKIAEHSSCPCPPMVNQRILLGLQLASLLQFSLPSGIVSSVPTSVWLPDHLIREASERRMCNVINSSLIICINAGPY
jgi:hypothetical protein